VNLALVFVKAAGGVLLHSSSLLADAGHSAADILSDILTLSTISFSAREPTLKYPLGFGKVETLGAIGVSSLLRKTPAILPPFVLITCIFLNSIVHSPRLSTCILLSVYLTFHAEC